MRGHTFYSSTCVLNSSSAHVRFVVALPPSTAHWLWVSHDTWRVANDEVFLSHHYDSHSRAIRGGTDMGHSVGVCSCGKELHLNN